MDHVRRRLLAAIAALGGGAALPVDGLENLRHLVDGGVGTARLEDWEEIAWEYGHAIITRSLPEVISELALDVLDLQRLVRSVPGDEAGWARVNARMTFLLAHALGSAGQAQESRHWWITARRTAEQSGDGQLVAAALGYEAMQGLYERRPLPVLLDRAGDAIVAARDVPCPGLAEALGVQAQVKAMMGDEAGAREALDETARVHDRLPESVTSDRLSVFGCPGERLLHGRSFVATYAGHSDAAQAQREALAAYPAARTRQIAMIRLHEALSEVRNGHVAAGLDHARDVLNGLPVHDHTRYVRYNAAKVLEAVPQRERRRPAVADFDEYLRSASTSE